MFNISALCAIMYNIGDKTFCVPNWTKIDQILAKKVDTLFVLSIFFFFVDFKWDFFKSWNQKNVFKNI